MLMVSGHSLFTVKLWQSWYLVIMTMMINYDDGNNDFDDGDINASAVSLS